MVTQITTPKSGKVVPKVSSNPSNVTRDTRHPVELKYTAPAGGKLVPRAPSSVGATCTCTSGSGLSNRGTIREPKSVDHKLFCNRFSSLSAVVVATDDDDDDDDADDLRAAPFRIRVSCLLYKYNKKSCHTGAKKPMIAQRYTKAAA